MGAKTIYTSPEARRQAEANLSQRKAEIEKAPRLSHYLLETLPAEEHQIDVDMFTSFDFGLGDATLQEHFDYWVDEWQDNFFGDEDRLEQLQLNLEEGWNKDIDANPASYVFDLIISYLEERGWTPAHEEAWDTVVPGRLGFTRSGLIIRILANYRHGRDRGNDRLMLIVYPPKRQR